MVPGKMSGSYDDSHEACLPAISPMLLLEEGRWVGKHGLIVEAREAILR